MALFNSSLFNASLFNSIGGVPSTYYGTATFTLPHPTLSGVGHFAINDLIVTKTLTVINTKSLTLDVIHSAIISLPITNSTRITTLHLYGGGKCQQNPSF